MKKIIIMMLLTLLLTGCSINLQTADMSGIKVYTGVYPIEYITKYLYGANSRISSIYPLNNDYSNYQLNDKLLKDYSKADLFVFAGNLNEKQYAIDMVNENDNLKIIDATYKLNYQYDIDELWLNPSNAIMVAKNVKNGLNEYITNRYLREDINQRFEYFNAKMTELDADYNLMANNSKNRTLIFMDNTFHFYQKYGFNVITLEGNNILAKDISEAKSKLASGEVKYVFSTLNLKDSPLLKQFKEKYNVSVLYLDPIHMQTETDALEKETYMTKMHANQELLKKELYR